MENFDFKEIIKFTRKYSIEEKANWFSSYINEDPVRDFYMREIVSPVTRDVEILDNQTLEQKKMLMFGSNGYLDLANNDEVWPSIQEKVNKYGIGLGGPPLLNGYTTLHKKLETKVAQLKNKTGAMLFSSGYTANLGLITGLTTKKDLVIFDEYSHASLVDGIKLSQVKSRFFTHNNMEMLEELLIENKPKFRNIFIAFESLYSMDGDTAPLNKIVELAKKYGAYTILDDCHATGVMGEKGTGGCEAFSTSVDFIVGSFSKAFSMTGGFICADESYIDYLRVFSRQYMFSTSMPTLFVAGILSVLESYEKNKVALLKRIKSHREYIMQELKQKVTFAAIPEASIVVLRVPSKMDITVINKEFHSRNIFVNSIHYPAVPIDEQRIRISLMASHTSEDIAYLVENIKEIWLKYNLN